MDRVHSFLGPRQHCMASFMPRCQSFFFLIHDFITRHSHRDNILSITKVAHFDRSLFFSSRLQRCFVHQFFQFCTAKAHRRLRNAFQIHVIRHWHFACVNFQNAQTAFLGGQINGYMAVKATGAQQGRVKHVGPICRGQNNHCVALLETVHLAQNLVQRLLTLVVATTNACTSNPPHRVNLVDEDNAWRRFASGLEQIAHTSCSDTDKHLNKLRPIDRIERNSCFTCGRPSQ